MIGSQAAVRTTLYDALLWNGGLAYVHSPPYPGLGTRLLQVSLIPRLAWEPDSLLVSSLGGFFYKARSSPYAPSPRQGLHYAMLN